MLHHRDMCMSMCMLHLGICIYLCVCYTLGTCVYICICCTLGIRAYIWVCYTDRQKLATGAPSLDVSLLYTAAHTTSPPRMILYGTRTSLGPKPTVSRCFHPGTRQHTPHVHLEMIRQGICVYVCACYTLGILVYLRVCYTAATSPPRTVR